MRSSGRVLGRLVDALAAAAHAPGNAASVAGPLCGGCASRRVHSMPCCLVGVQGGRPLAGLLGAAQRPGLRPWPVFAPFAAAHMPRAFAATAAGPAPTPAGALPNVGSAAPAAPVVLRTAEEAELDRLLGNPYTAPPGHWSPDKRRTGLLAVKAGMTCAWDAHGVRVPLTMLWIDDCEVIQVKTAAKEGFNALQVGAGARKPKQVPGVVRGHFERWGTNIKRHLAEFAVSDDALLPPGTLLGARHFVPGQHVDVAAVSKGKGFAGVMKRWGFGGGRASHGASLSHRIHGSTGQRQDPGKVFKGKKMAGHMGHERITVQSLWLFRTDPARNLLFVRGQVPGPVGGFVEVKDAIRKRPAMVPYPTHIPQADEAPVTAGLLQAPAGADPWAIEVIERVGSLK